MAGRRSLSVLGAYGGGAEVTTGFALACFGAGGLGDEAARPLPVLAQDLVIVGMLVRGD
jgi:hypothetical protein